MLRFGIIASVAIVVGAFLVGLLWPKKTAPAPEHSDLVRIQSDREASTLTLEGTSTADSMPSDAALRSDGDSRVATVRCVDETDRAVSHPFVRAESRIVGREANGTLQLPNGPEAMVWSATTSPRFVRLPILSDKLRLSSGITLTGVVRDENDRPLSNALVYLSRGHVARDWSEPPVGGFYPASVAESSEGLVYARRMATNSDGSFRFDGLEAGPHLIHAEKLGYVQAGDFPATGLKVVPAMPGIGLELRRLLVAAVVASIRCPATSDHERRDVNLQVNLPRGFEIVPHTANPFLDRQSRRAMDSASPDILLLSFARARHLIGTDFHETGIEADVVIGSRIDPPSRLKVTWVPAEMLEPKWYSRVALFAGCPGHARVTATCDMPLVAKSDLGSFWPRSFEKGVSRFSLLPGSYRLQLYGGLSTENLKDGEGVLKTFEVGANAQVDLGTFAMPQGMRRVGFAVRDAAGRLTDAYVLAIGLRGGRPFMFNGKVPGDHEIRQWLPPGEYECSVYDLGSHVVATKPVVIAQGALGPLPPLPPLSVDLDMPMQN